MSRFVVVHRQVGNVAHWCTPCASVQAFALVHEILEGRLWNAIPVGGGDLRGAIGQCHRCGGSRALAPERFRNPTTRPIVDMHTLMLDTHPALAAQLARLAELRRRRPDDAALQELENLIGHPRAEALLALAEAGSYELGKQLEAARRGAGSESRAEELVSVLAASYPASSGLWQGLAAMLMVLAVPLAFPAPLWAWVVAMVAAGGVARFLIGSIRHEHQQAFVQQILKPRLAEASIDHGTFLATLGRYRNGGHGATTKLQDMANDRAQLASLLAGR